MSRSFAQQQPCSFFFEKKYFFASVLFYVQVFSPGRMYAKIKIIIVWEIINFNKVPKLTAKIPQCVAVCGEMIQYNIHGQKLLIFEDKVLLVIIFINLVFWPFQSQPFFTGATQINPIILHVTTSLVLFILHAFNWVHIIF